MDMSTTTNSSVEVRALSLPGWYTNDPRILIPDSFWTMVMMLSLYYDSVLHFQGFHRQSGKDRVNVSKIGVVMQFHSQAKL
jgi:hypothetical protein